MRGDMIYVQRTPLGFKSIESRRTPQSCWLDELIIRFIAYKHYGIDLGDDMVVHYRCGSILTLDKSSVVVTTLDDFKRDGTVMVDHFQCLQYSSEEVVNRALTHVATDFGGYHPKYNNCEHFASWCVTGQRLSRQDLIGDAKKSIVLLPLRAKQKVIATIAFISFFSN